MGGCLDSLSEVLGGEHALGTAQDGVLGRVIRMLFRRDLQHGWDGLHVGVNGVADHLGDELVDQDDADVVPRQEAPDGRKTEVKTKRQGTKPHSDDQEFNTSTEKLWSWEKRWQTLTSF